MGSSGESEGVGRGERMEEDGGLGGGVLGEVSCSLEGEIISLGIACVEGGEGEEEWEGEEEGEGEREGGCSEEGEGEREGGCSEERW